MQSAFTRRKPEAATLRAYTKPVSIEVVSKEGEERMAKYDICSQQKILGRKRWRIGVGPL
jgi:hypothetical protein